ncbi:Lrp/AsnC family transcriptional regulator [Hirschia maritima]|uniref:Lrp/AsnC family transcriptional regulator n=1 Tax=Hirschia maritima TaxID=1121961 RepID=UPI00036AA27F|nr:Lrp/AsnC family transcriptional regulator [Hirschia maritima]
MSITEKDDQLINVLRENARMSVTDIAATLGVSRSTAQKRLEKIEEAGVISSYTVVLSEAYQKARVRAHISVTLDAKKTHSVISKIKENSSVEEIHSVSGDFDLIVIVSSTTVEMLDKAIDALIEIDGVERTSTAVILSTKLKR